MLGRPFSLFLSAPILSFVVATAAHAHTYTVGPGAGTDFPDLPTAIAASQPDDVLLVQPAQYAGGFTLDKGLTIIGYGSVLLSGPGAVANLPASQRAAIVHMSMASLSSDQCIGTVVWQEISSSGSMSITQCTDVRLLNVTLSLPPLPTATALTISGSRVEIVDSDVLGSDASQAGTYGSGNGGIGLHCQGGGSRVHLARSIVIGGGGQDNTGHGNHAGNGASGIWANPATDLILAGGGQGIVHAGYGGTNFDPWGDCCYDGEGAAGVTEGPGDRIWYSGTDIRSTPNRLNCTACSTWILPPVCCGGTEVSVSPNDPTLDVSGGFTPFTAATLTLHGPAGAHASLALGRRPVVVPDSQTWVESLVGGSRTLLLGVIPSSGTVSFALYDSGWPAGTLVIAQANVALPTGEIRRTNSIPMVFR